MPLDVAVAPTTLTSTLHYLKRGTEKPASYRIEPPPGVPRWNGIDDPHDVKIEDARGRESEYEQVRAVPLDALRYWHYTTVSRTPGGFAAFTANKQLPDPNSLFAASVATRCARRDRPEAGRRPRNRKFESISLQQTVCLSPAVAFEGREPGFPRGFGQLAWRPGQQRLAGCFDIASTGGNISVGPYSSTAVRLVVAPGLTRGRSVDL